MLGGDPYSMTSFLQVHNRLEEFLPTDPIIKMYGKKAKPSGFGNSGGGMELDELERFAREQPEWFKYYSSFGTLSQTDLALIGCALRESVDESGFTDIQIVLDEDTKELITLTDSYSPEGHRVVTLWGQYRSYHQRPIKEKEEVDYVAWVDLAMPVAEVYKRLRKEISDPFARPYWSHIRRSLIGISKIDQYHKDREEKPYLINRMVHPSWRLVFRVGRRDDRFPDFGYLISPTDWYQMLDVMIDKNIEHVDEDFIFSIFKNQIVAAKDQQERKEERESAAQAVIETMVDTTNLADSEDYTGIPTSAEILHREDEEYARWLENELNIPSDQRVTESKPVA